MSTQAIKRTYLAALQNFIDMMNENNPSGNVASSQLHITVLAMAATVSVAVGVKRFLIGLYLGRQTFSKWSKWQMLVISLTLSSSQTVLPHEDHYGEALATCMNKMVLVSHVASLAKAIEKSMIGRDTKIPVTS